MLAPACICFLKQIYFFFHNKKQMKALPLLHSCGQCWSMPKQNQNQKQTDKTHTGRAESIVVFFHVTQCMNPLSIVHWVFICATELYFPSLFAALSSCLPVRHTKHKKAPTPDNAHSKYFVRQNKMPNTTKVQIQCTQSRWSRDTPWRQQTWEKQSRLVNAKRRTKHTTKKKRKYSSQNEHTA